MSTLNPTVTTNSWPTFSSRHVFKQNAVTRPFVQVQAVDSLREKPQTHAHKPLFQQSIGSSYQRAHSFLYL